MANSGSSRAGWNVLLKRVKGSKKLHGHHPSQQSLGGQRTQNLENVDTSIHERGYPNSIPNRVDANLEKNGYPKGSHPSPSNGSRKSWKGFLNQHPDANEPVAQGEWEALEDAVDRGAAPIDVLFEYLDQVMEPRFK